MIHFKAALSIWDHSYLNYAYINIEFCLSALILLRCFSLGGQNNIRATQNRLFKAFSNNSQINEQCQSRGTKSTFSLPWLPVRYDSAKHKV